MQISRLRSQLIVVLRPSWGEREERSIESTALGFGVYPRPQKIIFNLCRELIFGFPGGVGGASKPKNYFGLWASFNCQFNEFCFSVSAQFSSLRALCDKALIDVRVCYVQSTTQADSIDEIFIFPHECHGHFCENP